MRCPRDTTVLTHGELERVEIDLCPTCGGVWLERNELYTLVQKFSVERAEDQKQILQRFKDVVGDGTTPPKDFWQEGSLVCPTDGHLLHKGYYAGSQVGIDRCVSCGGVWLDGAEIGAVMQMVKYDPLQDAIGHFVGAETRRYQSSALAKLDSHMYGNFNNPLDPKQLATSIGMLLFRLLA